MINEQIFREYDIRGVVDDDLDDSVVEKLGQAIGSYIPNVTLVLGRDNRLSSDSYHNAIIKGLVSSGVHVIDIGMVPTPVLYYALRKLGIPSGVMITGSHNPPEFNGFKIAVNSHCIYGKEIKKIYEIIKNRMFKFGTGSVRQVDVSEDYINEILARVKLGRKLKIVVDAGNGTAGPIALKLLSRMGCDVIDLFCEPDGNFPNHHPDPTKPDQYKELIRKVVENKADCGIAYDGDADRIGAIDETGRMIYGDEMMILFAREILEVRPNSKVCIEVKCSQGLVEDVKHHGGIAILCATGHSLIEAKMEEEQAMLAGEMSGHIYFADEWYGFDDAIYSGCRLLRILSRSNKTLSRHLASAPKYFSTPEIRVHCDDNLKFDVVKDITKKFKEDYEVIDIDGARVIFPDGWGLIRASNTQPMLVVRAEAKSEDGLEKIKDILRDTLLENDVEAEF